MGTIAYRYQDNVYLNLTSRCPTACVFCVKRAWGWDYRGHDLKLRRDPSAAEVWSALIEEAAAGPFQELVFCGYGESTYRLTELQLISAAARQVFPSIRQRLNTIGLGCLIQRRDIVPDLAAAVDAVSVSLNTAEPREWARLHAPRPPYADAGFAAATSFVRACARAGLETTVTAVEGLGADPVALEVLARSLGARFRLRPALA